MLISSGAGSSGADSFTSDACAGMQSSGSSGGSGRSKLAGFALHLGSTVADACSGRCWTDPVRWMRPLAAPTLHRTASAQACG